MPALRPVTSRILNWEILTPEGGNDTKLLSALGTHQADPFLVMLGNARALGLRLVEALKDEVVVVFVAVYYPAPGPQPILLVNMNCVVDEPIVIIHQKVKALFLPHGPGQVHGLPIKARPLRIVRLSGVRRMK